MIFTIDTVEYDVDIEKSVNITYMRAIKFQSTYNGNVFASDRGIESDKYEASFKILGLHSDINSMTSALYDCQTTINIDFEDIELFGSAIDYTTPIDFLYSFSKYPIRDTRLSYIDITVRPVTQLPFKSGVVAEFPQITFEPEIVKNIDIYKNNFDSIKIGSYGVISSVNDLGKTNKREKVQFKTTINSDKFAKLHKYIATVARGNSFLLPYNELYMSLFNDDSLKKVYCESFNYKMLSHCEYEVSFILVKDEFSI